MKVSSLFFPLLICVCIGFVIAARSGIESQRVPSPDTATVTASGLADTPFFVFPSSDPDDFSEGVQFFGSMDKVGVHSSVMDANPGRDAAFEFIRDKNAERMAYLSQNGVQPNSQSSNHWLITVREEGNVAGQQRLGVYAEYGHDSFFNGGVSPDPTVQLSELWEFPETGKPTLIERTHSAFHIGLNTLAESPPPAIVEYDQDFSWGDPSEAANELFP
ncbi:MAG: hypothetical protein ACE361_24265 [Aureliella sp.]